MGWPQGWVYRFFRLYKCSFGWRSRSLFLLGEWWSFMLDLIILKCTFSSMCMIRKRRILLIVIFESWWVSYTLKFSCGGGWSPRIISSNTSFIAWCWLWSFALLLMFFVYVHYISDFLLNQFFILKLLLTSVNSSILKLIISFWHMSW